MTARRKTAALTVLCAFTMALSSTGFTNAAVSNLGNRYEPVSAQVLKTQATEVFADAREAGRLSAQDIQKFQAELNSASSLPEVEQAWANIEATAQVAKNKHVSLDSLLLEFQKRLNTLKQRGISPETDGWKFYTDRLAGIKRIQKYLWSQNKDHIWLFWDWAALSVDLSSVQERLTRAVEGSDPTLESFDDLMLRTDNYMARNDVAARSLATYKSFEVEPEQNQAAKQAMWTILQDRAHSRLETPEVKSQLTRRLRSIHYEAVRGLPSEKEVDLAIVEVQRLIDAGARNGHLSALDDVRIQHELELIKQMKRAYPGPTPGIDPIEKELRMEEVRFMSMDLRFLQDWLGRLLRADGDTAEGREHVLRVLRRTDLAYFSHRITHQDALNIVHGINTALRDAKNDAAILTAMAHLQGRLDMMVADFSMVPANTMSRYNAIQNDVQELRIDRDDASRDLQHAGELVQNVSRQQEGPQKYGNSIVAATELEMIRSSVNPLLQKQRNSR